MHTSAGEVALTLVLMTIYMTDIDRTLNETDVDKVLQYRPNYNNRPSHGCLHGEFIFLQTHRENDRFLEASRVQLA